MSREIPDRAGEALIRHLELRYALAAARGDVEGQHATLMRLAGRPGARPRSFSIVRAATAEIVDRIPTLGGGEGFTRQQLIDDLQAELDALEVRCPGLAVEGAW